MDFSEYLPFIIPLAIVEITLMIVAVVHILKHPHYRTGSRTIWLLIAVLFGFVGPILYFVFGRGEDE
ncbi:MAG: PLDc_N domain-containing protein [Eubacterium sp.]|nr:PLDc_N domain-containing protein [Eubacterium sp.]